MKILFGWELGAGQGHIQRLVALAQKFEAYGHTPVFALKSYNLKGIDFPWQRLDPPPLAFSGREESFTFADILSTFGFGDVTLLRAHLQGWRVLLQTVQPALVITDHAPGLVLAAQNIAPTMVIGSPFAVPPPVETLPIFRFPAPAESLERQKWVSDAVHQVSQNDAPLGQILNGDRSFIFSVPELDWYRAWRRNPEYVGAHLPPMPLQQPHRSISVWGYLAADYPLRERVLKTLNPDCEFKPLHQALANQGLAIHHGGLTTAIVCLLAGIPQLVLPRYVEQQLTTIALQQLGVAEMLINPSWEDLHLAQARAWAMADTAYAQARRLTQWNQNLLHRMIQAGLESLA